MKGYLIQVKKIPIPLALTTVLMFFSILFVIDKTRTNLLIKTKATENPSNIKISNITSDSFTVSWLTKNKTTGTLIYGEKENLDFIKSDIRDKNSKLEKYNIHYVVVENLKPQTKYFFKIISDGKEFDNNGKPFEIQTGPLLPPPSEYDISQGKVFLPNLEPAKGVIVYLSLSNSSLLSALTDNEGRWVIPLSSARNTNLTNYITYDKFSQIIEIFIQGDNLTSTVTLTTGGDDPTPDIVLGKDYNFLSQNTLTVSPTPIFVENPLTFPTIASQSGFGEIGKIEYELKILYPSENEKIATNKPEFLGIGPKNETIEIKIESKQEITDSITIESTGEWKWVPPVDLEPGQHKITVTYTDKNGFVQTISKIFTVLATGESNLPSFTSSPSGTLITPTVSFTPTHIISISPSPTILLTISPTSSPTSAVAPRQTIPSTESGEIKPGISTPTFLLIGGGVLIMIGSILIFFL